MKTLDVALKISLVLFMVGNLLNMGLGLKLQEAFAGLRNVRFIVQSVAWGFILCPAFAWLLARIVPLDPAYGIGLVLLGMAPCAPFPPADGGKAR
jgi:BASS family bile acid:Na+ symporter